MQKKALILKAISGFYYCKTDENIVECKARGVFRNNDITPLVGDNVIIETSDDKKGIVEEILQRKNDFLRPPLANIDKVVIVISIVKPVPNLFVIDKLIAVCEYKNIEPVLVFTKIDMKTPDIIEKIYGNTGIKMFSINNHEPKDLLSIKEYLSDGIIAFVGNTGVGKSSLINNIFPELELKTGEVSEKLNRGRHTTRHVELYELPSKKGYLADTPGFGNIETEKYADIKKDELQYCFREFKDYLGKCRFNDCAHLTEKDCAVIEAVNNGIIEKSRHENYIELYKEAKERENKYLF